MKNRTRTAKSLLFDRGKYPELDGLRAMAILLVVATHIAQTIPGLSLVWWNVEWMTPLYNGWIGVDLFFVLSGFLIGSQILKQLESNTFSFLQFYLRRAFRILPAYFAVVFLFGIIVSFFPTIYPYLAESPFNLKGVIKNILLITNYFPHDLGIRSWSLSIEEQFYWIIPFILYSTQKWAPNQKSKLFLASCGAALLLRILTYRYYGLSPSAPISLIHQKIYFPLHTRMDTLAAGVLVALSIQDHPPALKGSAPATMRAIALILLGFVFVTGALSGGWLETTLQYSLLSLGFALFVWGILSEPKKKQSACSRFLGSPIWTPVARLSYSLYLCHILTIKMTEYWLQDSLHRNILIPPVALLLSLVVALALFFGIESPLHQWSKERMG